MINLVTLHLTRAVLPVEPAPVVSMVDSMEVALVEPDLAAMVLAVVVSVVAVLPETVGIRNTTLRVVIWMICSRYFREICSTEEHPARLLPGFWDSFHGGFQSSGFQSKGSDLNAEVTVGFDEAAFGCDKVITLQDPNAPGNSSQSLKVHIPAGIDTGKTIRLRGKGMPGTNGGDAGDLMLKVKVADKPGYERKGMDVYTTVTVPFTTAVFGGEALVQTLYGNVLCKIREGTQSGSKIRLKGKGIVSMKNPSVHGDQYVTVQIEVPRHLTPQAKEKLREYEPWSAGTQRVLKI